MKPALKKGHRWLRVGEIVRKGDWFYDNGYELRPASVSIGSRVSAGCVGSFSRSTRKSRAKK